jgi:hypothetical protein
MKPSRLLVILGAAFASPSFASQAEVSIKEIPLFRTGAISFNHSESEIREISKVASELEKVEAPLVRFFQRNWKNNVLLRECMNDRANVRELYKDLKTIYPKGNTAREIITALESVEEPEWEILLRRAMMGSGRITVMTFEHLVNFFQVSPRFQYILKAAQSDLQAVAITLAASRLALMRTGGFLAEGLVGAGTLGAAFAIGAPIYAGAEVFYDINNGAIDKGAANFDRLNRSGLIDETSAQKRRRTYNERVQAEYAAQGIYLVPSSGKAGLR